MVSHSTSDLALWRLLFLGRFWRAARQWLHDIVKMGWIWQTSFHKLPA